MERNTRQRRSIVQAIARAGRPLGPREILALALDDAPGLGIATVYRTIKSLVEQRAIKAVQLPGQPARYEPADKHHHHYFRCRSCDQVFDIPGCPGNLEPLVPPGFEMDDHEVVLYGRCRDCRAPASARARRKATRP